MMMPQAFGEVMLQGDLAIQQTDYGARYLGEVINDTPQAAQFVQVVITVKDENGEIIDMPNGFINGYHDPDTGLNTFLPAGFYAPFMFHGIADSANIASYEVAINYTPSELEHPDTSVVALMDSLTITGDLVGTTITGEIVNNSSNHIYFTAVSIAAKDADGTMLDVESVYVFGDDYIDELTSYSETLIQPGGTAPFKVISTIDSGLVASAYPVITYRTGGPGSYSYFGDGEVTAIEEPELFNYYGFAAYRGEIVNNIDRAIYFVKMTVVTRDIMGTMLDVNIMYVSGTDYEISPGYSTPTGIEPGESAFYEMVTLVPYEQAASYDYFITYRYSGEQIVAVEEETPVPFALGQNYPNPFNPDTVISFTLPEASQVRLDIYNLGGQRVETLVDSRLTAGSHAVTLNAAPFASGVYVYLLSNGTSTIQHKMILVK